MGDSLAAEAWEKRKEPPTFTELFADACTPADRAAGERILQLYVMSPAAETAVALRRKLAEAKRQHQIWTEVSRSASRARRIRRHLECAEAELTELLRKCGFYRPQEHVVARDVLRQLIPLVSTERPHGRAKMPYVTKFRRDDPLALASEEQSTLLRAIGVPVPRGRIPRTTV